MGRYVAPLPLLQIFQNPCPHSSSSLELFKLHSSLYIYKYSRLRILFRSLIMASLSVNQESATTVTAKGTQSLKIHGFSFTKGMGVGNYISSDPFFAGGHSWEIRFYPDGYETVKDKSGQAYVSLYVALVSKCKEGVEAYCEYVLLDQSGNKWHKVSDETFAMGSKMIGPFTFKVFCGYSSFYKRTAREVSRFVNDDCLTIQCTVGVVKKSIPLPVSDLLQSYRQLLESKEESDVSFQVEGEVFYAHKLILSTRSSVFKAQFFGPLKEVNTQRIKIEDMQAPIFKALLQFIYYDVIPDMEEELGVHEVTMMTWHLLAAADRYGIERLRSICEARLCEKIDIDNVASTLALAAQHGCILLKAMCLEFIGLPENLQAVMQTDGFKNLKENYPAVIDDLLKSVARVTYVSYGPGKEGDANRKRVKLEK